MSAVADANSGTTSVRPGFGFDEGALATWMASHVEEFAGPVTVEQFNGGQSNPTYKLVTPTRDYVMRRRPSGILLRGAHDVGREARVLSALGTTDVPVPRVYGLCEDEAMLGSHFYVMEMVAGRIFWDASIPEVAIDDRRAIYEAMNATIAALHRVDDQAVGLADFGRPGNYLERQLDRLTKQYRDDERAGRDPNMDQLIVWLMDNLPAEEPKTSIIHGDFRIDNLIFHPTEPRVVAVLDWELSTLGNPHADFAFNAMMYRMPPDIVAGLAGHDVEALGLPSESEYLARYCRNVGLPAMPAYDYYVAFQFFRLAAILHGINGRLIRGTAASPHARKRADAFPALAALAWRQTGRATG